MKQIYQSLFGWTMFFFVAFASQTANAKTETTMFDRLAGHWAATSNSFSKDAQITMIWSKTLGGHFYRINYQIKIPESKSQNFSGIGYYKVNNHSKTKGYWADNGGDLHPLSVQITDQTIMTIWGIAGAKQGRTEYRLTDDGKAVVTDWLLDKEGWRKFNETVFSRITEASED